VSSASCSKHEVVLSPNRTRHSGGQPRSPAAARGHAESAPGHLVSHLHLHPGLATSSSLDQRPRLSLPWLCRPCKGHSLFLLPASKIQAIEARAAIMACCLPLIRTHLQAIAYQHLTSRRLEMPSWWSLVVQMSGYDATMLPHSGMQFHGPLSPLGVPASQKPHSIPPLPGRSRVGSTARLS